MSRFTVFAAVAGSLVTLNAAHADALSDARKEVLAAMRSMVGMSFWVSDPPGPIGVEFCPSPTGRFKECRRLRNMAFSISAIVPSPALGAPMFQVQLETGQKGFIPQAAGLMFRDPRLDAATRQRINQCERDGPTIGMTAANVRECWGVPDRVNTTQTANGKHEQWIYPKSGAYVYISDGVVTSLQTTR